jgi:hypothetical protein
VVLVVEIFVIKVIGDVDCFFVAKNIAVEINKCYSNNSYNNIEHCFYARGYRLETFILISINGISERFHFKEKYFVFFL